LWCDGGVVSAAAATDPKGVVLVYSFGRNFRLWRDNAGAIRAELLRQSPWLLEIFDHSLTFARFCNEFSFVEVFSSFEMGREAQGQNAGQSGPAECQP
jgi:hypothetical protein